LIVRLLQERWLSRRPTTANRERRVHHGQRVNQVGSIARKLERDGGARRVPHHVRSLDAEMPQQSPAVLGMIGDAERPGHVCAVAVVGAMVGDQPILLHQGRLREKRPKPVGQHAGVDQQDRLAGTLRHVAERHIADLGES
jgi:hypothetical protein